MMMNSYSNKETIGFLLKILSIASCVVVSIESRIL